MQRIRTTSQCIIWSFVYKTLPSPRLNTVYSVLGKATKGIAFHSLLGTHWCGLRRLLEMR